MSNNNDGTKQILAKIDKQNFINMNYQNENDNGFNSVEASQKAILNKLSEIEAKVEFNTKLLSEFQGQNDNSFTVLLNYWKEFNSKK